MKINEIDFEKSTGTFTMQFKDGSSKTFNILDIKNNESLIGFLCMNKGNFEEIKNTGVIAKITNNNVDFVMKIKYKQTSKDDLKECLIEKLKEYNNLGFLHTTSVDNLDSIYKEKYIYSRNLLKLKNINLKDIANPEVLERTDKLYKDCVRFYLRKNTPANYNFNSKYNNCILVCNYKILFSQSEMYITERIATHRNYQNSLDSPTNLNYLINKFNYDMVFNQEYVASKEERDFKGAEFLVKDKVSIENIWMIIFNNNLDKDNFHQKFPNWNIKTIVNTTFFAHREDL